MQPTQKAARLISGVMSKEEIKNEVEEFIF